MNTYETESECSKKPNYEPTFALAQITQFSRESPFQDNNNENKVAEAHDLVWQFPTSIRIYLDQSLN